MIRWLTRWVGLAVAVGGPWAIAQDVTVSLDKDTYVQGELIQIEVAYTGNRQLRFQDSCTTDYMLDGVYFPGRACLMAVTDRTGPFSDSHTFTWRDHVLSPGRHYVQGIVPGTPVRDGPFRTQNGASMRSMQGSFNPTSPPVFFTVLPRPKPQQDFRLDFKHWPGDPQRRIDHLAVYELFGLRFRTSLGAPAQRKYRLYNDYYLSGFDPEPVGYNVAVDFSLPVFGAQAYVGGRDGTTVTMLAKNASGVVIASAVSPVLTGVREPLDLRTTVPIASLEWWPSDPASPLEVDDMLVRVIPAVDFSVSNESFHVTWPVVEDETYRVWFSSNLLDWVEIDIPIPGGEGLATKASAMDEAPIRFFRVGRSPSP